MDRLARFLTDYYAGRSCRLYARGSAGLYALFRGLRELKGEGEIIIPAICCETVAMAAIYAGMRPVFVDVEPDTLCMSYETVCPRLSENTVAIVLVYIFGNSFDLTPFETLKDTHDVVLIEDVAQAVGGRDHAGKELGRHFDFTLLSIEDRKILKGQGGAIIQRAEPYDGLLEATADLLPSAPPPRIQERKLLSWRNFAHALFDLCRADPAVDISRRFHDMLPHYRSTIALSGDVVENTPIIDQYHAIQSEQARRYEKYQYYRENIRNALLRVTEFPPGAMCWRLPVLVQDGTNAFHITAMLRRNGILVSNHYFPLDKLIDDAPNPNAASIGGRVLNLWVDDLADMDTVKTTVDLLNAYCPVNSDD